MNTKNLRTKFVFIIPTLSNNRGLKNIIALIEKFYPNVKTIVVNNNPQNSIDPLRNIIVIHNKKNDGFAKACNDGAKKAHELFAPTYFVFLNDDVTFDQDWVHRCIATLVKNHWAATSPLLINTDNEVENYGYKVLRSGKVQLIKDKEYKKEVDGITAAALVIKSDIFLKLNGFDERFFAYLEDVDLCLRLKKNGYTFGVTKETSVVHAGQATSSKFKTKKAYFDFRNWILLISKNWSRQELIKNFPDILIERCRNFWGIVKSLG